MSQAAEAVTAAGPDTARPSRAREIFDKQKAACLENPYPDYDTRRANLLKLEAILVDNQDAIAAAISKDFGNRAFQETQLLEIFLPVDLLRYSRKHLRRWMKPQKRKVSIWFAGAKNRVLPQPKGVVGVIAPWNYPLFLVIGPLASALSAGNRCMVKMAANSQNLCRLLAGLISEQFDEDTLAILPGVPASEFTPLPWDHLVFTGSPYSGKTVMKTAAENLTPVTLELGGKSPTIVCGDFDMKTAAERILHGKFLNAGQTCVGPDYLFVPEGKVQAFIDHAREIIPRRYPQLADAAYTSIIDSKSYDRLNGLVEDAREKGANIINLMEGETADEAARKIPPTLMTGVNDNMEVMQDEIFGPILPVMAYRELADVLAFINRRERPLALYLFTDDKKVQDHVLKNTLSGGVCINDCVLHAGQHDMPFGGVGNSGMGHYHAREGFVELSKMRPVFKQFSHTALPLFYPPYGKVFDTIYKLMIKLRI
jgi:coniferyl-aldehyde dehydrogenase